MSVPFRRPRAALVVAAAAALILTAGCAGTSAPPAPAVAPAPVPALTVIDPWVKAYDPAATAAMEAPMTGVEQAGSTMPSGEMSGPMNMTAVFGTFTVNGSAPVTVLSASTSASPRTELHEVVTDGDAKTMRVKEGGFEVVPGTPRLLAPGGDHIMLMDLAAPIRAGDQVEVTLNLSDGSTTTFTALAKETTGGKESYETEAGSPPAGHGG